MACMGPSKDFAYQQGEEAFEKIMALLKEEYQIQRWSFPAPSNPGDVLANAMHNMSERNAEVWDEKVEALKIVLKELIWHQHCMDF